MDTSRTDEINLPRIRSVQNQGKVKINLSQSEVDYPENRTQKVITGWTEHADFPHYEEYDEAIEKMRDEIAEKYDIDTDDYVNTDELVERSYQGDKLGGWAFWTQGNETPNHFRKQFCVDLLLRHRQPPA